MEPAKLSESQVPLTPVPDGIVIDLYALKQEKLCDDMARVLALSLGNSDPVLSYVYKASVFDGLSQDDVLTLWIAQQTPDSPDPEPVLQALYDLAAAERRLSLYGVLRHQVKLANEQGYPYIVAELGDELDPSLIRRLQDNHDTFTLLRLSGYSKEKVAAWPDLTPTEVEYLEEVLHKYHLKFAERS